MVDREVAEPARFRSGRHRSARGNAPVAAASCTFPRTRWSLPPFDWTGDSIGARELVHTGRKVTITTALLRPPWADTFLILNDNKAGYVRAETSVFARRRLGRALRESGVTVAQRTSLAPSAATQARLASPARLDPLGRGHGEHVRVCRRDRVTRRRPTRPTRRRRARSDSSSGDSAERGTRPPAVPS